MKTVIILRCYSGSGKSTFAKQINSNFKTVSADNYFYDDHGNYNFDPTKLGDAHADCKRKFEKFLEVGENVIVDNTNVVDEHCKFYDNLAKEYEYAVFWVMVENRQSTKNQHGVPSATLHQMMTNLKHSVSTNIDNQLKILEDNCLTHFKKNYERLQD